MISLSDLHMHTTASDGALSPQERGSSSPVADEGGAGTPGHCRSDHDPLTCA